MNTKETREDSIEKQVRTPKSITMMSSTKLIIGWDMPLPIPID
jgi:hypothetical protein